jgi:carbon starvation protein CstA
MSSLVLIIGSIVVFLVGYVTYGGYLAKQGAS